MIVFLTPPTFADAAALCDICFAGNESWSLKNMTDYMTNPSIHALAYYHDKNISSLLIWQANKNHADIFTIATRPNQRRCGQASTLIQAMFAINHHVDNFFLESSEHNQPALALYQSCGFETIGKREHYYGKNQHASLLNYKRQPQKNL